MRLTLSSLAAPVGTGPESGMSLISALIGVAIAGVLAVTMSTIFTNGFRATRSIELRSDKEAIKQMMLATPNCPAAVAQCTAPGQIVALSRMSAPAGAPPFVSRQGAGTKFGSWTIRAECNATKDGIVLRAARLKSSGTLTSAAASQFVADPMTGITTTWSDPRSLLFEEGIEICSSAPKTAWIDISANCVSVNGGGGNDYCAKYSPNVSYDEFCRLKGYSGATNRCKITNSGGVYVGNTANANYYAHGSAYIANQYTGFCYFFTGYTKPPKEIECLR